MSYRQDPPLAPLAHLVLRGAGAGTIQIVGVRTDTTASVITTLADTAHNRSVATRMAASPGLPLRDEGCIPARGV